MTNEEINSVKERIFKGLNMVMDKAEQIGKSKDKYSIEELGQMSDIVKDCSEAICNLTKHKESLELF